MKISAKGRYALASLLFMVETSSPDECVTLPTIAKSLSISKIYLEQTFSLLKKADIVVSVKGAQGGYQLSTSPQNITCLEILSATESSVFEQSDSATNGIDSILDGTLETHVFAPLNQYIETFLENITLEMLFIKLKERRESEIYMFYI